MSDLSDADVDAMEARAQLATAGPWEAVHEQVTDLHWGPMRSNVLTRGSGTPAERSSYVAEDETLLPDWQFIAAARTNVPRLCAEVRRLRAVLAAMVMEDAQ